MPVPGVWVRTARVRRKRAHRCLILLAAIVGAGFARAETAQVLLERYKCNYCHSAAEAGTGPSFAEIAAKYRGNANAVGLLTAEVRKGAHGGGPWHMPPHPEISAADARTMIRYILSVKN